jgi:hypothetical protein
MTSRFQTATGTVIASAAKQSMARQAESWIASSHPPSPEGGLRRTRAPLAMTASLRIPAAQRAPGVCQETSAPQRGRGECRAPSAPAGSCAWVVVECTRVVQVHRNHPAFPHAMVYGYFALSPEIGRSCLRHPRKLLPANLTPASRRQDHTTWPSASSALVRSAIRVHRHPPRVRDDRDTPLWWDGMAENIAVIWLLKNRNIFL